VSQTFGKYQVIDFIGEGGFGRVYRSYDPALKRHVAIKTCTLRDAPIRERFVREAEIAASLRHANIVTVYDFGEEAGEPYLVQEYLEGEDLDRKLKRGDTFATAALVEWLRQVADGLLYAHARGVVHRDVKPANIRILPDGNVRIMDFGIAKLMEADRQLTQTGFSVGTANYLAPEQLRGEEVDHRADIFSYGAMAYELVARRKPFEGDSITTILYRLVHEDPPPLRDVVGNCPPRLAVMIERCLRKQREERFTTFAHVIAELEDIASDLARGAVGRPVPVAADKAAGDAARATDVVQPAAPRRRVSPAVWGLLTATAAVAMFGIFNLWRPGESATSNRGGAAKASDSLPVIDSVPAVTVAPIDTTLDTRDSAVTATNAQNPIAARGPATDSTTATTNPNRSSPLLAGRPRPRPNRLNTPAPGRRQELYAKRVVLIVRSAVADVTDAAETVLTRELLNAGFEVIDAATVRAADPSRPRVIAQLGRDNGAATIITADVTVDVQPLAAGMHTGSASLALKAYATSDSRLVGTERFVVGSSDSPGEVGPTPAAAATAAVRAVAFQAARFTLRRLNDARNR
jgi:serine/threonine-protein kinase